jgi:hypothetical protein
MSKTALAEPVPLAGPVDPPSRVTGAGIALVDAARRSPEYVLTELGSHDTGLARR